MPLVRKSPPELLTKNGQEMPRVLVTFAITQMFRTVEALGNTASCIVPGSQRPPYSSHSGWDRTTEGVSDHCGKDVAYIYVSVGRREHEYPESNTGRGQTYFKTNSETDGAFSERDQSTVSCGSLEAPSPTPDKRMAFHFKCLPVDGLT